MRKSHIGLHGLTEGRMRKWERGKTLRKNVSEQMKSFKLTTQEYKSQTR